MDLETLFDHCEKGAPPTVCVVIGGERFLIDRAVESIRTAALGDGPAGFNDDVFYGRGLTAAKVEACARTLPMMAERRFVLVRDADQMGAEELGRLAETLKQPVETASVVILGEKLDGRSKLVKAAKSAGVLIEARELKGAAVRRFVTDEAKRRGHRIESDAASALVDSLGSDLGAINDALERLSLFVGASQPLRLSDVEQCVTRLRTESVWALVDAIGARDAKVAVAAAESLLQGREPPLKILALIARQLRILAKMREALSDGLKPPEATKRAGAPPFKARELTRSARAFPFESLQSAFAILAEADLELKGARRPGDAVLQETVLRLCRGGAPSRFSSVVRDRRRLVRGSA